MAMAGRETPMAVKLMAAVVAVGEGKGAELNVTKLCREAGTTPKTFYKWVKRYRQEGLDGLQERSRRPHISAGQTPIEIEEQIVRLRKELADAGLDHGATTIQWHLGRMRPKLAVPAVSTIYRILQRRGLVAPEPRKSPKKNWKRFEAGAPNEMWQIDAMNWTIATGQVQVFNIIDDHSRVATRSRAVVEATTEEAWATFSQATAVWGLPARTLSDNGLCFSGKLRSFEVFFEAQLRDAGIEAITGRPYHPQTTGKVERFQQTLKKWLRRQPLAESIDELQDQLDRFCVIYNLERPHQGIGRAIPIERWRATPAAGPASEPLAHPDWPSEHLHGPVDANGVVNTHAYRIHVGAEYAGCAAIVIADGTRANVFIDGTLVRHLKLDRSRRYQPSGRPRGGPRKPRLTS